MNELDPRTYASYAQGREAQANGQRPLSQAQQRQRASSYELGWKGEDGRFAANDAWDKKYGQNSEYFNDMGSHTGQKWMQNGEYNVHTSHSDIGAYGYERTNSQRNYNPYDNTYNFQMNDYDYDGNQRKNINVNGEGYADEGERVARQMATGSGNYQKGKGWQ